MAPRKSDGEGKAKPTTVTTPTRVTRSMARKTRSQTQGNSSGGGGGSSSSSSKLMNFESPEKKKKRKPKAAKGDGPASKKIKQEEEDDAEDEKEPAAVEEAKKPEEDDDDDVAAEEEKGDDDDDDDVAAEEEKGDDDDDDGSEHKRIVIEHCKQCKSFKERANEVKDGLEIAVPGIIVTLNPDKPRRGCFEIREEGGEKFVSLLDLKRPFKDMKDLDMEKVVADIVAKLK